MQFPRFAILELRSAGKLIAMLLAFTPGPVGSYAAEANLTARWAEKVLDSLDRHPRLMAGQAARDMAVAKVDLARQPVYQPQIALEWKQRGSQSGTSNIEVFLAQKIDLLGKKEARTRISESESEAIREEYQAIRQDLLQTILNGLAAKWTTARLQEIANEMYEQTAEFIILLEKYEKAGRISAYEVENGYLRLADATGMIADAEEQDQQNAMQLAALIGDTVIPDHLPLAVLGDIRPREDIEHKVGNLASVAAARWRYESSRAGLAAVEAERLLDPTVGLVGGKDENDNFIGLVFEVPLALRSSAKPSREVSSQAAAIDEQKYLESVRLAQSRLRNAGKIYRSLFARWQQWRSLTAGRVENRESLLRRLWDSGEISGWEYLTLVRERTDTRSVGIRLNIHVWTAWIDWLAAGGELEAWLASLAAYKNREIVH